MVLGDSRSRSRVRASACASAWNRGAFGSSDHSNQHRHDAQEKAAAGLKHFRFNRLDTADEVENCGAFGGRTLRHAVEASLVLGAELTGALGDVENDRCRRSQQLVRKVTPAARELPNDVVRHAHEIKSGTVDVEALVIKLIR